MLLPNLSRPLFLLTIHTTFSLAALLINYIPSLPISSLGTPQLEGLHLGDRLDPSAAIGSPAFIQPDKDPQNGRAALHFHREPEYRRAEVKAKGDYSAGRRYFVGWEFRLGRVHEHLVIFQWKKEDKSEGQNIPFNLQFTEDEPTRLSLGYTPPGTGPVSKYRTIWTDSSPFDTGKVHNIALAWDTMEGSNNNNNSGNKLELWLDGAPVFSQTGLNLWTGYTYAKLGIYRGEMADHNNNSSSGDSNMNVFDLYIYRVQLSDKSLEEISATSGIIHH